jgi:hypothetical protein
MNWPRGLLRLWLLATALWAAAVSAYFYFDPFLSITIPDEDLRRNLVRSHIYAMTLTATIPPAVLFALDWTVLWVARGFARHRL